MNDVSLYDATWYRYYKRIRATYAKCIMRLVIITIPKTMAIMDVVLHYISDDSYIHLGNSITREYSETHCCNVVICVNYQEMLHL